MNCMVMPTYNVHFSIDSPRCHACQFLFREEDNVVADITDAPEPHRFTFSWYGGHLTPSKRLLRGFYHASHKKPYLVGSCYHETCYALRPRLGPVPSYMSPSTTYSFSPPASSDDERRIRIEIDAAEKLGEALLHKLPPEICDMIVSHTMTEYPAVSLSSLGKYARPPQEVIVDLSRPVYVSYIAIEGRHYYRRLWNSSTPPSASEGHCLFNEDGGRKSIQNIYIAFDYLGILAIHFQLTTEDTITMKYDTDSLKGIWWAEIPLRPETQQFKYRFDGLKIRQILDPSVFIGERAPPLRLVGWPAPMINARLINLQTCAPVEDVPSTSLRMQPFNCDAENIDGYIAVIMGGNIQQIHPCVLGSEATTEFFSNMDAFSEDAHWIYFPLRPDERLEELWAVILPNVWGNGLVGLIIRTNHNRAFLFGQPELGPDDPEEWQRKLCRCVYKREDGQRHPQVYFNDLEHGSGFNAIHYMALEETAFQTFEKGSTSDWTTQNIYRVLTNTTPPPTRWSYQHYHQLGWKYNSSRLEGVIEVTCCYKNEGPSRPAMIVGLLLRFLDDSRICVGQYRPDQLHEPFLVDPQMALKFMMGHYRSPGKPIDHYVEAVVQVPIEQQEGAQPEVIPSMRKDQIDVRWGGMLEWWWEEYNSELYYIPSI